MCFIKKEKNMTDIEYLIHGIALDSGCWMEDTGNMVTDDIDLFSFSKSLAKLAAQVEREACAKVCDEASDIALVLQSSSADDLSSVFLRHQTLAHQKDAAAIRARTEEQK